MSSLLHETVISPQGVENAIISQFTGQNQQLITTIKNQLICYDITSNGLEVRCKEVIEGNVIQMESVRVENTMLLILLFRDAKVSVMKYNESLNKFVIHSLHSFELPQNRMREHCTPTTYKDPKLLIDKRGRCMTLICYDRLMWVIPLGNSTKSSHRVDLEKFEISRIIDCIVLDGYELPTIAFLHMKMPTWAARTVNTGENTNELVILSLDPEVIRQDQETEEIEATLSYKFSFVPYDALQIVDCFPMFGVLILTGNSVIYLSTTSFESFILPFGKFFSIPKNNSGIIPLFRVLPIQMRILSLAKSIYKLTERLYIVFSMNGESYYVHLLATTNRVCDLAITNSPFKFNPTEIILSNDLLFVGSTVHDSYLYKYGIVEYGQGKQHEVSLHINQDVRSKNLLLRHNEMEEEYPFDEPQLLLSPQELTVDLPEVDTIISMSNIHDYALIENENGFGEIAVCSGLQPFGRIMQISRSIQPERVMGMREIEWFYKNENENILVNKNGIFYDGKIICGIDKIGNIKRVKEDDQFLIIESVEGRWSVFGIYEKEIIRTEEGIDGINVIPSNKEMEEVDKENQFLILKEGKIIKGSQMLVKIGEKYVQWKEMDEEMKISQEFKTNREGVVEFECLSIVEGKMDLVLITNEGILCYYRSLNNNGIFERLKVESPQQFNCSLKPQITSIRTNDKKHILVTGNSSFFIEYNHKYPLTIPFSIQEIKEAVVIDENHLFLNTNEGNVNVTLKNIEIDKYPLPLRKTHMQGTPHHIVSFKNKIYVSCSVTTTIEEPDRPPQLPHSSNQQQQLEEPPILEPTPLESEVFIERYRIIDMETNEYHEFKKGQFLYSMKVLKLRVGKQNKNYLVVSVNKQTTEDYPAKGHVYLFNIENEDQSIKLVFKVGDGKKAVHSVNEIGGFLAVAAGNELEILFGQDERTWLKKCFSDVSILINSIQYLPLQLTREEGEDQSYLIILSDLYRSVTLLLFRPDGYKITPLGRDGRNVHSIDSTFILTQDYFCLLEFDVDQNLSVLNYLRAETERLSIFDVDATFNLGMNIIRFTRLLNKKGYVYMYVTFEGSVGYVTVVDEKVYQVLRQINSKMNREPWHFAGANPEEYRFEKGYGMGYGMRKNVILDGDMLKQFRLLNEEQQKRVCLRNTSIGDVFKLISTSMQYNTFLQYKL